MNKNSGLPIELADNGAATNGTNYHQGILTGENDQKMELMEVENGVYGIWNVQTNKPWDIGNASIEDEANLLQWGNNTDGANRQFILVDAGDGFYQLVARHSGKVIEVAGAGLNPGDNLWQYSNSGQDASLWTLEAPVVASNSTAITNAGISIYPNPTHGMIHIRAGEELRSVEILDLKGRVMLSTQDQDLSVRTLEAGVYIIKVVSDSHTEVLHFTKE